MFFQSTAVLTAFVFRVVKRCH